MICRRRQHAWNTQSQKPVVLPAAAQAAPGAAAKWVFAPLQPPCPGPAEEPTMSPMCWSLSPGMAAGWELSDPLSNDQILVSEISHYGHFRSVHFRFFWSKVLGASKRSE